MGEPVRRKVLLLSGRRSHRESIPLDGTRPMPQVAFDEEVAPAPPPAPPPAPSPKTRLIAGKVAFAPAPPTITEAPIMAKKDETHPYVQYLTPERGWMGPKEIGEELGEKRARAGAQLRELAEAKRLQAHGKGRGLRYAALGVPPPGVEKPTKPKAVKEPSKPKAKKEPKRRRNLAEFGAPPPSGAAQLPATVPSPGKIAWAITDQGDIAINDGKNTIKLSPADTAYGVKFLEQTQLLWQVRA